MWGVDLEGLAARFSAYAVIPGRLFLAAIFLWSGLGKVMNWEGTAGYMAMKGMPLIPLFLALAILFELGGGLSLLIGFKGRLGALALFAFLVPTTLIFHNFWAVPDNEVMIQTIMFLKNLAIMGGLLMVAALGTGPFSLGRRKV
jgi:putative oxidoreductase